MAWDLPVLNLCLWHLLWWVCQILKLWGSRLVSFSLCALPALEAEKACHSHSSLKHIHCPEDKLRQNIGRVSGVKQRESLRVWCVSLWECALTWYHVILPVHRDTGKASCLISSPTLSSPAPEFCVVDTGLHWFAFWSLEQSGPHSLFS